MASESRKEEISDIHIEMWKHYDNLRQQKNSSFLTGHAILAAIAGFTVTDAPNLVVALSIVGIVIAISWFLLLARNASYIAYHRERVGQHWKPASWTPPSGVLDRTLPVAFGAFWTTLLILRLFGEVG